MLTTHTRLILSKNILFNLPCYFGPLFHIDHVPKPIFVILLQRIDKKMMKMKKMLQRGMLLTMYIPTLNILYAAWMFYATNFEFFCKYIFAGKKFEIYLNKNSAINIKHLFTNINPFFPRY